MHLGMIHNARMHYEFTPAHELIAELGKLNLSQGDIAKLIDVDQATISRIYTGKIADPASSIVDKLRQLAAELRSKQQGAQ